MTRKGSRRHSALRKEKFLEFARGWRIVLSAFFGFSFYSLMTAALGVFFGPLGDEFGWSRGLLAAGFAISAFSTALLSPFAGSLIDKFGSRRVALPGLVLTGMAMCAFSLLDGSAAQWVILWIVFAFVSLSVKATVWTKVVANNFTAARGMAFGLILSGTAASQIVVPPLATWLIAEFGWRTAFVWLGCGWGGGTLLLCCLFLRDSVTPLAPAGTSLVTEAGDTSIPGLSVSEAMKDRALQRLALSTLVIMFVTSGLIVHQMPILTDAGISRSDAAWLASLAGVAGVISKITTGILLDSHRANWIGCITLSATSLAFVLLLDGIRSPALILVAIVVNGYSMGAKLQICSYLTAQHAGMKNFGKIYGFMTSMVALGTGLGPLTAGLVFDTYGNYSPFLITGALGCLLSGIVLLGLPSHRKWSVATS